MKTTLIAFNIIVGIAAFCAFIWGFYWVTKTGSYWLFYEDTIREMVKPEYLIGKQ